MNPADILRQASELGISLSITKDRVQYRPKSAASPEFVQALRQNKPAVMRHLTETEDLAEIIASLTGPSVDSAAGIATRLQKGQIWLNEVNESFYAGTPTTTSIQLSRMMALWDSLEQKLRGAYGYIGCIHGPGDSCPIDTAVRCDGCIGSA